MISLCKVISTKIGDQGKRFVKLLRMGKSDIQEPQEAGPHGVDSNPIKGLIAVYAKTSENGKPVVVGYLIKDKLAASGETRIFSTNGTGIVMAYSWHKNDGTIEFNGNANNLVRYSPLDSALQIMAGKINTENVKIAAAFNALVPGLYVPAPVTVNTLAAKILDLKST